MESSFFCHACNKQCNSSRQFSEHKMSPAHLAQEKKTQDFAPSNTGVALSNTGVMPVSATNTGIEYVGHVIGSSFTASLVTSEQGNRSNALTPASAGMENRLEAKTGPNGEFYTMNGSKGFCYVCQVDLTSHEHCSQHINGKNHAKKIQQRERERSNGNSFMPFQPQEVATYSSSQLSGNPAGTKQAFESNNLPFSGVLQCKICKVPFSCEQNAKEHFVGKKHKKELARLESQTQRGISFLDEFSSDPDQTEVLKVGSSPCNNPSRYIGIDAASFERHKMDPRCLLTNADPSDLDTISDNFDNNLPLEANVAIPSSSVKRDHDLRRTCSENLSENIDKVSLLGKKLDSLSLFSGSSQVSSISNNNMQPSNIPSIAPVNPDTREATEQLTSLVLPAQRSFSCPAVSPNTRAASDLMESISDEDCYRFDGKRGHCYACTIELTSREHALQHLNGEKHKKKSRMFKLHPRNMHYSQNNQEPLGANSNESPLVVTKGLNLVDKLPEINEKYYNFSGTSGYCHACKCSLSSRQQAEEHIKGRPHDRNVQIMNLNQQGKIPSQHCEACDMSFTGEVPASQHFSSEKHKRNTELLSCPAYLIPGIEDARMITDRKGVSWYFCDICRKPLNTKEMLLIHQKSPGHLLEKNNKNENRLQNQVEGASDTLSQTNCAAAQILQSSMSAEALVEKGTISESQRKMLTIAQNPVINAEPSAAFRPNHQDNHCLNQPSPMPYSYGSMVELRGSAGRERHEYHRDADTDENKTLQSNCETNPSSHVNVRQNDSVSRATSISSPSSSSSSALQCTHQNTNAGMKSHADTGNPTGPGNLEGSLDVIRKPQNSRTTRRSDCIRNINMNEQYDPNMVLRDDLKEKPPSVPNITDAENFQQCRTSPPPAETTCKSTETRDLRSFPFSCELCRKPMNTKDSYDAHIKGNTHRWNVTYSKAKNINLGVINKNVISIDEEIYQRGFKVTKTFPRNYQVELMLKAMQQDSVIYLPTGTGKTLVSALTIGLMLEDNFQRPVIFLVDKILLVIQQGRYIEEELKVKSKEYTRFSLTDREKKVKRSLNLAFVCGGMTHSQGIPLWQHDIIVTTAAYCYNMLQKGTICWEHFSLAVFDEVHHCHKDHPYKKLISCYHTKITDPARRPKILGLSASPAGKDTVENTLEMLRKLLDTLGGSRIAIPEGRNHDELKRYQSDPKLSIICVPLTSKEQEFQLECYKYFLRCYRKFARMSQLCKSQEMPLCYFNTVVNDSSDDALKNLANNLLIDPEPLSEIISYVMNANCTLSQLSEECQSGVFDLLRLHMLKFFVSVAAIPTGVDFKEMESIFEPTEDNHELENARRQGLPCESMKQHILSFKDNEKGMISPMLDKLLKILRDIQYIDWKLEKSKALVLVRERKQARNVSKKLQQTEWVRERNLRVTHLVGHGRNANDEGMQVKQQKRVIDNHDSFHILVATSIAEEGIDIRKLGLVISMNPPSTVRALVQMRGRARLKDSHFVILCATEEEEEKLKKLIRQEQNMLEAAQICLASER